MTLAALRAESGLPDYSQYKGYGPDSGRPTGLELYERCASGRFELRKPYFVGRRNLDRRPRVPGDWPEFHWVEPAKCPAPAHAAV